MVRNYKKKGTYATYKPEIVDDAVSAVCSNLMSVRGASKEFGIPPTTLHNWVKAKVKIPNFSAEVWGLKWLDFDAFFKCIRISWGFHFWCWFCASYDTLSKNGTFSPYISFRQNLVTLAGLQPFPPTLKIRLWTQPRKLQTWDLVYPENNCW